VKLFTDYEHAGKWQDCAECRASFPTEIYVWYGTNKYNFEKLPNCPRTCWPGVRGRGIGYRAGNEDSREETQKAHISNSL
jgi:hypothetical protein